MHTAIVILNWNGKKLLEKFLPSVVAYSADADIIIADNCSTDDSISYLKSNFPQVKILQNDVNEGFAKGYNTFLQQLKQYKYYVILNNDVAVTKDWLLPIIRAFEKDPMLAAAQPKILSYRENTHFEYAGAAGGYLDFLGYPYCRGRIVDNVEKDDGQYDDNKEIHWASGAALFIRSQVYHQLGGFDESFFAHQEEIDLCWRIRNTGKYIYCIPSSVVYHLGAASLAYDSPHKTYLNFRNNLIMIIKNISSNKLLLIVLIRLKLDAIVGMKFLFNKQWRHTWAIIKAHWFIFINIKQLSSKRKMAQSQKTKDATLYDKSIIWQYYIKGIKTFQHLT